MPKEILQKLTNENSLKIRLKPRASNARFRIRIKENPNI
jgi:hypothetical protein